MPGICLQEIGGFILGGEVEIGFGELHPRQVVILAGGEQAQAVPAACARWHRCGRFHPG